MRQYCLNAGPFRFSISTSLPLVQHYLEEVYAEHLSLEPEAYFDYAIQLLPGKGARRWWRRQVRFCFNHQMPFKPMPLAHANAVLEWGMNWVIAGNAHQYLIVHAAVVAKNGKAVIICAPSGSGKSTLCAYLVSRGWKLLSDELALVDHNTLTVEGLNRPMNLKNGSIPVISPYFQSRQFSEEIRDTHKGTLKLLYPDAGQQLPAGLHVSPSLLVFVKHSTTEKCFIEKVPPCEALTEILQQSFNHGTLHQKGFVTGRKLVDHTPAVYVEYSDFSACERALETELNSCSWGEYDHAVG
ncbi:HprK-related kinase A [Parasalinivibrio latis]|uniref:HprK-related kinase A n=1 Tax=Parasalinivibrio latis TaxID=2952610 RepID=UPI0030DF58B3